MVKNKVITLENGQKAISLPKTDRNAVVVDFKSLQRIVSALGFSVFSEVKKNILEKIEHTVRLEDLLSVMENEVIYHRTIGDVNLLDSSMFEEEEPQANKPPDHSTLR